MNLSELKREIPYKWREGPNNKELAYIDARDVMDLLDEVVGAGNWQCDYKEIGDKVYCGIGIRMANTPFLKVVDKSQESFQGPFPGMWVWKWDVGTETDFEGEKGEASDAFKRAAVKWGIGRFLYGIKPSKKTQSFGNKATTRDSKGKSYCKSCGSMVSGKVEQFSVSKFGKALCMDCQKKQ